MVYPKKGGVSKLPYRPTVKHKKHRGRPPNKAKAEITGDTKTRKDKKSAKAALPPLVIPRPTEKFGPLEQPENLRLLCHDLLDLCRLLPGKAGAGEEGETSNEIGLFLHKIRETIRLRRDWADMQTFSSLINVGKVLSGTAIHEDVIVTLKVVSAADPKLIALYARAHRPDAISPAAKQPDAPGPA
jgi:hypothetical protein